MRKLIHRRFGLLLARVLVCAITVSATASAHAQTSESSASFPPNTVGGATESYIVVIQFGEIPPASLSDNSDRVNATCRILNRATHEQLADCSGGVLVAFVDDTHLNLHPPLENANMPAGARAEIQGLYVRTRFQTDGTFLALESCRVRVVNRFPTPFCTPTLPSVIKGKMAQRLVAAAIVSKMKVDAAFTSTACEMSRAQQNNLDTNMSILGYYRKYYPRPASCR